MLSISIDGQKVDQVADSISYSNVDPGGFETASFTIQSPVFQISKGAEVTITEGTSFAWHGRVEEPGKIISEGQLSYQINAVGYGSELKTRTMTMIYVDRLLSNFRACSTIRRYTIQNGGAFVVIDGSVESNVASGLPSVHMIITDSWTTPLPLCQMYYLAGAGNFIGAFYADYSISDSVSPADTHWNIGVNFQTDDAGGIAATNVVTVAATGSVNFLTPNPACGVMGFDFYYAVAGGAQGQHYDAWFTNIAVFGTHGLTVRTAPQTIIGVTTRGLYLSDILADVLKRSKLGFNTNIQPNQFVVTQSAYRDRTSFEQIVIDLHSLVGWHWGVWEPSTILDHVPCFWSVSPPAVANARVRLEDCDEVDVTESYSSSHDSVVVRYSDAQGEPGFVTLSRSSPQLNQWDHHELSIDMGVATPDSATAFASYVLSLDQSSTRGSGSCQLPIVLSDGRPAHLLKAGRDKIQITDLSSSGSKLAEAPSSVDVYRISRVEVTVTNGVPRTKIEFDQGADLIEVLQARLAQDNSGIGF